MKLSVILASYNENQYLDESITSCLEQSFKDFEIIIGDDGSDDGSLDTIKNYANKYSNIRYFVMNRTDVKDLIPSIRVSNLIKRAISQAKGEYIICLSGDDYFVGNNVFTTHIANLDKDVNHKYSASVANYAKVWSDGKKQVINARKLPSRNYWATDYLHLSCFMFRKEIYDSGLFLDNFCDDTGLQYTLACEGNFIYTNQVMFAYRQREKSIVHESDKTELYLMEIALYNDILNHSKQLPIASLSRFSGPLNYFSTNSIDLKNLKYQKYLKLLTNHKLSKLFSASKQAKITISLLALASKIIALCYRVGNKIFYTYNRVFRNTFL